MNRRSFLSAVVGTVGTISLAGCTGGSSADVEYVRTRDRDHDVSVDDLEITRSELVSEENPDGAGLFGNVRNDADDLARDVVVTVTFVDADGTELGVESVALGTIRVAELFHVPIPSGVSFDEVEDYDISLEVGG